MRKGNRELIKQINQNIILNLIRSRGPISRTAIARLSDLSLAAVSGLTADLLEQDFVREVGEGESTGGRPPVLLKLNPRGGFVVGLKLTEQSITLALTDLEATVISNRSTPLQATAGPAAALEAIVATVNASLQDGKVPRDKVLGVGIGLAGVIDSQAGICRYSPFLGWRDVELVRPLTQRLQLPVCIENDVNTLTIAEQWFGAGHDREHFLVVTLGRGIGLGIVVNGQFYHGAGGGAGEFGHLTMHENGPLCDCGKRGCLEAFASDPAILRFAHEAIAEGRLTTLARRHLDPEALSFEDVIDAAEQGDALAREVLARSGRYVGLGLAHLTNLFNPQLIILSGEGLKAGASRLAPMLDALRRNTFDGLGDRLEVVVEPLGDETWSRGAACVVLSELFKHPIHKSGPRREQRAA